MSVLKHRITAVLAGSALVVGLGATGAVAGNLIGSADIRDGGVHRVDLGDAVNARIDNKATEREVSGLAGRVSSIEGEEPAIADVESDGPYPGATQLTDGANSTSLVTANGESQTVWVQCAPGKVALGGGFTLAADAGQAAAEAVTVTESAPTQIAGGAEVYNSIAGDTDGSFLPNAWKVVAINDGASDVVVRPHVICATVAG